MSKREELEEFPLYKKAEQIFKITQGLVEIVPADNEFLQETTVRFMLEDAMIIPAKIAGAHAVELYDLKMENVCLAVGIKINLQKSPNDELELGVRAPTQIFSKNWGGTEKQLPRIQNLSTQTERTKNKPDGFPPIPPAAIPRSCRS